MLSLAVVLLIVSQTKQRTKPLEFRFRPCNGTTYEISLDVEWQDANRDSSLFMESKMVPTDERRYTLTLNLVGARVNGQDASKLLTDCLLEPGVTVDWNDLGQRAGGMSPLKTKQIPQSLMPLFREAGIYLCEFPRRAIQVGDTWRGTTTASGGCTSGEYHLDGLGKVDGRPVAFVSVDNIALFSGKLLVPIKFAVDLETGVPLTMTYQIDDPSKGGRMAFTQTITLKP